jgi:large subunit ribosomal protein L35
LTVFELFCLCPLQINEDFSLFPFTSRGVPYVFLLFSTFLMQKTRKSIAKRFKKTGTGKLLRRTPGHRHLLRNKSVKQRRRAGSSKLVADGQAADLKRAMPYS